VYIVGDDNKVRYQAVEIGVLASGQRVIREGIAANDRVIMTGLQRLRPGMTVEARPQSTASEAALEAEKLSQAP
jgi:hypothetical protein